MSEEQLFNVIFTQRRNVFLTGGGGCGKSWLLNRINDRAKELGYKVALTATTGIAAIHIGGCTFHRWAGIKLAREGASELAKKVKFSKQAKNWRDIRLLLIDEISMFGGNLLDKMDYVAKELRHSIRSFGKIQVVFCGDMCQLGPVRDKYVFLSDVWDKFNFVNICLSKPYRFDNTIQFNFLQRVRYGFDALIDADIEKLRSRHTAYVELMARLESSSDTSEVRPTILYSTKNDVSAYNMTELKKLPGRGKRFICEDRLCPLEDDDGNVVCDEPMDVKKYMAVLDNLAPTTIMLKPGAQVMLTYNSDVDSGLCNGARGVVTKYGPDNGVYVKFVCGQTVLINKIDLDMKDNKATVYRKQMPLILAWARTIHKCVDPNTLLFIENGMIRIQDLAKEDQKDDTYLEIEGPLVEGRKSLNKVSQIYKGGKKDCYCVETSLGYTITGTENHRLQVYTKEGKTIWKKIDQLTIDDRLLLRNEINRFSINHPSTKSFTYEKIHSWENVYTIPDIIDDNLCHIIGLLIGGGCYSSKKHNSIEFCCNHIIDGDIGELYNQYIKKLFGKKDICIYKCKDFNVTNYTFQSKQIRAFFKWCGLDFVVGHQKKIPWVVLSNTKTAQIACLQGLFDTDGGVNKSCVHFTSASKQLVIDIQTILLNIGIISSVRKLDKVKKSTHHQAYRLQICGYNAHLFCNKVGFKSQRKQKALEKQYANYNIKGSVKSNICDIPNGRSLIKDLKEEILQYYKCKNNRCNYLNKKDIGSLLSGILNGTYKLRYHNLQYMHNYFSNNLVSLDNYGKTGTKLFKMATRNIFMDKISSIIKTKAEVYDIYIPKDHTFLGNGIINHNCQSATLDYVIVDLGPSIFATGQAYVALSRCKTLDGVFLSNFVPQSIKADPVVVAFDKKLREEDFIVV